MSTDQVTQAPVSPAALETVQNMKRLNNKERCRYRTLIGKKLESMGIKDESIPVESARKLMQYFNTKTGKMEKVLVPKYTLQNLNRRMIRQLETQPKAVIDAFLRLDQNAFKRPSPVGMGSPEGKKLVP